MSYPRPWTGLDLPQADEQRAEIVGGSDDGDLTEPIPFVGDRDYVTIKGVRHALRVVRMPKTEDKRERTVLLAIHPGFPTYPL